MSKTAVEDAEGSAVENPDGVVDMAAAAACCVRKDAVG